MVVFLDLRSSPYSVIVLSATVGYRIKESC
jgi:hypothetical protein